MRTYQKPQGKLSVDQQTVSGTVALHTYICMQTRKKEEIDTRDIHLNANTNWKKQAHSNLQPEEKEARGCKTSCQKKNVRKKGDRKVSRISAPCQHGLLCDDKTDSKRDYQLWTGSMGTQTRDTFIRVGSAQIYQHSSFKIC